MCPLPSQFAWIHKFCYITLHTTLMTFLSARNNIDSITLCNGTLFNGLGKMKNWVFLTKNRTSGLQVKVCPILYSVAASEDVRDQTEYTPCPLLTCKTFLIAPLRRRVCTSSFWSGKKLIFVVDLLGLSLVGLEINFKKHLVLLVYHTHISKVIMPLIWL